MDAHKWAEQETQALISAGVNPLDAQRSVAWTLANVPPGVDPAMWMPSITDLDAPPDKAAAQDALAAWFADKPPKWKRLISAVTVKNG